MEIKEYLHRILDELTHNTKYLDNKSLSELVNSIKSANHIYLSGAGRSKLAIQGFTNRLMHLGFSVSQVGEISSPHTGKNDLLIIGSGSGETDSLISLARKAKKENVKIILVTMDSNSTIGKMSDFSVVLPGVSPKLKNENANITSIQPMGSAFEQMSFLVYDSIILELMKQLNETSKTMFERHANLE